MKKIQLKIVTLLSVFAVEASVAQTDIPEFSERGNRNKCERYEQNVKNVGLYVGQDTEKYTVLPLKGKRVSGEESVGWENLKNVAQKLDHSTGFCLIFSYRQAELPEGPKAREEFKQYAWVLHSKYELAAKQPAPSGVILANFGFSKGYNRSITLDHEEWAKFKEKGPSGLENYLKERALKLMSFRFPESGLSYEIFDDASRRSAFVIYGDLSNSRTKNVFESTRFSEKQDGSVRTISKYYSPRNLNVARQVITMSIVDPTKCVSTLKRCVDTGAYAIEFER